MLHSCGKPLSRPQKSIGTFLTFANITPVADDQNERKQRRRARIQLLLGLLQLFGATAGVVLLITTGASVWTLAVVGATMCVTVLSRTWFPRRRQP
jgi:hypothetical protein